MKPFRPNLMVVDDEAEVLRTIHDLFRMEYRVLTFTRGEEALERLQQEDVPVVLTDQQMPGMNGVQFLQKAQQVSPETVRLLFTGYSDIRAVIDAINQGSIFRYISKPWEPQDLVLTIRQAVQHHDLVVSRRKLLDELQERNAQLVEANRAKTAFIEVASHELNTPLAVILGLSELWQLQQGPDASPTQQGWVDRMHAAAKRLAGIVERMLKLLRTDKLDSALDLEMTDVDLLIQSVVAEIEPFLKSRRQRVEVEVDPAVGSIEIDAGMIRDALTNLLVNAIKFSPDDREIQITAAPVGLEYVRFEVSDSGVGIKPDDRRHLFEPFFTCYDTLHHSSGQFQFGKRGIGLGLHLVKTFVELHGGSMDEVKSSPDDGTTFGFVLPRQRRLVCAAYGGL